MGLVIKQDYICYKSSPRNNRLNCEIKLDKNIHTHVICTDSSERKSYILGILDLLSKSTNKIVYLANQKINSKYLETFNFNLRENYFLILEDCQIKSETQSEIFKLKKILYELSIQVIIVGRDLSMVGAEILEVITDNKFILIQKLLSYDMYHSRIKYCTAEIINDQKSIVITEDSLGGLYNLCKIFNKLGYGIELCDNKYFQNYNEVKNELYNQLKDTNKTIKITSASGIRNVDKLISFYKNNKIVLSIDFIQDNAEVLEHLNNIIKEDIYILNDYTFEELYLFDNYHNNNNENLYRELLNRANYDLTYNDLSIELKRMYLQTQSFEQFCIAIMKNFGIDKKMSKINWPNSIALRDIYDRIQITANYFSNKTNHFL